MTKKIRIAVNIFDDGVFAFKIKKNYKEDNTSSLMQMVSILEVMKNNYINKVGELNGN